MDSKYSEIGTSKSTIPKFQVKSKPTPILFNSSSSPKKVKLENGEIFNKRNGQVMSKISIEDQRRSLPIFSVRNR